MGLRSSRANVATPGSLEEVGDLIGDLMGLVHRRSAGGTLALMNEAGLTMAQMVALYILDHLGAQTVSAIASFLNLSPAATSHLVDRLVTSGFVGRTEDPVDRRQKRVVITRAGHALAARVHEERAREFGSALALLAPDLQTQFARVLGRVVEGLRAATWNSTKNSTKNAAQPDPITRAWTQASDREGPRLGARPKETRTKKARG